MRNASLDALRAIATLMIVAYHILGFGGSGFSLQHRDVFGRIASNLNIGVSIFFTLSGYLLFKPFAEAILRKTVGPNLKSFYVKRAARIFPGYWVALITLALVGAIAIPNASGLIRNVFLVHPFTASSVFTGITQSWTLSVEVCFYLILPFMAAALAFITKKMSQEQSVLALTLALLLLALLSYAFRILVHFSHLPVFATGHLTLPAHLDTFALGMLVAVLRSIPNPSSKVVKITKICTRSSTSIFVASVFCWLLSSRIGLRPGLERTPFLNDVIGHFLYSISSFLTLIAFCFRQSTLRNGGRFLSRSLTWLGSISYGIYLWHHIFVSGLFPEKVMPYLPDDSQILIRFLIVFPASIVIASFSFYCIERPIMRLAAKRIKGSDLADRTP